MKPKNSDQHIVLWHGSQKWTPPPQVRAPKKGQAEHGAGIYTTTHYQTARKYAAGSGVGVQLWLKPSLTFIEEMNVNAAMLLEVARKIPRLRSRDAILSDIDECALRSRDGQTVGLNVLVNLAVNHNAMFSSAAQDITAFLVEQGCDASLYNRSGQEDWLVIFNPKIITGYDLRPAKTIDIGEYELPQVRRQMSLILDNRIKGSEAAMNYLAENDSLERKNSQKRPSK